MSERIARLFVLGASIFFLVNAIYFLSAVGTIIPQMIWIIAFYWPVRNPFLVLPLGGGFVLLSLLIVFPIAVGVLLGVRCFQWRSDPASHRLSLAYVGIIGLLSLSPIASLLAVIAAATSGAPLEFINFNLARLEITEWQHKRGFLILVA